MRPREAKVCKFVVPQRVDGNERYEGTLKPDNDA